MKKVFATISCVCFISAIAIAQDDEPAEKGFKKENLFAGGSVTVSFFNHQTLLGANPFFGYKVAKWMDAGLAFNYVYSGARDYNEFNDKIRQSTYGPGIFTRLYPVNFLFAQAQYEHNYSTLKYTAAPGSTIYQDGKIRTGANSLLLGAGFAQGRSGGNNTFYYISILFDVLKNINSPYVNVAVNPNNTNEQRVVMTPVIRAGFNIALFQGRR